MEKYFQGTEVNAYTSYKKIFKKWDLDIIAIPAFSVNHAKIALNALDHEINVICEKLMALSTADCDRIIEKEKKPRQN